MIKFKYPLNNGIRLLLAQTIPRYNESYLIGYMNHGLVNQLKSCKLYLVCSMIIDGDEPKPSYTNPLAIVASNTKEAIGYYGILNQSNTGTIMCELEDRCDNMKVEHA